MIKAACCLVSAFLLTAQVWAMGTIPRPPALPELQAQITAELGRMDRNLADAAQALSTTTLMGAQVNQILLDLYNNNPAAVDVATIDLDGKLLVIQPDRYKNTEGQNISDQDHFITLKKTRQPVLSSSFKTVEGFYAVSLARPVFDPRGSLLGFVSMVFKTDAMMRQIVAPYETGLSLEVMVLQKDGKVLYSKDIMQIGRLTFSDPIYQSYPELLAFANRMVEQPTGADSYSFQTKVGMPAVKKKAEWGTVSLYGTEWRIMISKVAD